MSLTKKQETQVAKAAKNRRAALRAAFEQQNAQRQAAPPKKTNANTSQPKKAQAKAKPRPQPASPLAHAFNAFIPHHLPVDEVTAPYTVTNLLGIMEFSSSPTVDKVLVIAPRMANRQEAYVGPLTDYIGILFDAGQHLTHTVPMEKTLRSAVVGALPLETTQQHLSTRGRLHNLSAKIECLGMNNGMLPPGAAYIGRVPFLETGITSEASEGNMTLLEAWIDPAITVGYLQSFSAASLASSPCTMHSTVAESVSYKQWQDFVIPAVATHVGSLPISTALEPIIVFVPKCGATGAEVNYRVTVGQEWCTRHPNNALLRATQKQHTATPPAIWHNAVAAAKRVGETLLGRAGAIAETYAVRAGEAAMSTLASTARASAMPAIAYMA